MKKIFFLLGIQCAWFSAITQNIGMGVTVPQAFFNVADGKTVLFGSDTSGAGSKLMWLPAKSALRAGVSIGTGWNSANIGTASVALGYNTIASGKYSFATGTSTTADGDYATAIGAGNNASGDNSVAIGSNSDATGFVSVALGYSPTASGTHSIAIGFNTLAAGSVAVALGDNTNATGNNSTTMGYHTNASGDYSTAMGANTTASGDYSTVIGSYVSSNNQAGSVLIGDNSTATIMASPSPNNFRARFANGYRLYTSGDLSTSCSLGAGDNAWSTGSDIRLKENFAAVDGEDFLKKIARFKLVSWNYKKQDPATFRHYGPMALDFYEAFGKDRYGTIGNDTSINQADFLGINLIAVQALEKRTELLSVSNKELKKENGILKKELADLKVILRKKNIL